MFPLMFKEELLGFMWALNFSADKSAFIKETLELTSFILASEIYSYRMVEHLKYMSYTDTLTKLPNRFACSERMGELIKRGEKFSVVSININHFKNVNDTFGFKAGNQVLIEIAKRWQKVADSRRAAGSTSESERMEKMPSDCRGAGQLDYITHTNGDEFMLVTSGYQTEEELRANIMR